MREKRLARRSRERERERSGSKIEAYTGASITDSALGDRAFA